MVVNAEESSDECEDLTEGNEDGGVDNAEWRNDEACYQECAAHDDERHCAYQLKAVFLLFLSVHLGVFCNSLLYSYLCGKQVKPCVTTRIPLEEVKPC